jgi:pyruvate ferredoxin oxidoreductase beta subunit/2-oxoisovalerate ferredoxin oxidoreductase beta subunit
MEYIKFNDQGAFHSGHAACPGCVEALAIRVITNKIGTNAVAVVPPSCSAVIVGPHPNSALDIPVYHTSLESSAASASGIRRALDVQGKTDTQVIVLAGDGGTYDIGFQALSSAVERNENILYFCFDNEGYMNTGGQKSSSTPLLAATGSTPAGKLSKKKNLVEILAAHEIPYVATASPGHLDDLGRKVDKARKLTGMRMIIIHIPCLDGWGLAENMGVTSARLAVESGIFPLYEVEYGKKYTLNHTAKTKSVDEYLGMQKRFRHLGESELAVIQASVDEDWERLLGRVANSSS